MRPGSSTTTLSTPEWTWASARLRLGQTNVGFWVVTSAVLLVVQPDIATGGMAAHTTAWLACVAVYVLLQLPFDIIGGVVLPARFDRSTVEPWRFAVQWLRGALPHALVLAAVGFVALLVGRSAGSWAAIGSLALGAGALVAAQGPLARTVAGQETVDTQKAQLLRDAAAGASIDPDQVDVVACSEPTFVGGWTGSRGLERLLVPQRWAALPPAELHAMLVRRRIGLASGARARGVVGALAFNTFGAVVTLALVPGATYATASGLLVMSAGITLWSFIGLLMLPTISRWAVTELDRRTADALEDRTPLISLIRRLDREQDDEAEREPWVEAIFHPVSTPEARIEALSRPHTELPGSSMWRITRMALFTSWAQASWLSRAVHCNIGRPAVWVVYPGD